MKPLAQEVCLRGAVRTFFYVCEEQRLRATTGLCSTWSGFWRGLKGSSAVEGTISIAILFAVFAGLMLFRRALAWTVAPRTLAVSVVPLVAVAAVAVSDGGNLCAAYSNVFGWNTSAPVAEPPAVLSASLALAGAPGDGALPPPPASLEESADCEACLDCGLCRNIRDCLKTIVACARCAKCLVTIENNCVVNCVKTKCGDPRGNPNYAICQAKCWQSCDGIS